jgi:hypothetical protein
MVGGVKKRCNRCGEVKSLSEFHRQSNAKDGRQPKCKGCALALASAYYQANRDRVSQYHKKRYRADREAKKHQAKEWRLANPQRAAESSERSRERHPEKVKAREALNHAVAAGTVVKPDRCEDCGEPTESRRLHGHHEDYSKPLDVEWLCSACHGTRHYP